MGAYNVIGGTSWEQRRVFREQFQCVGSGLSTEEMRRFGQQAQLLPFARFSKFPPLSYPAWPIPALELFEPDTFKVANKLHVSRCAHHLFE